MQRPFGNFGFIDLPPATKSIIILNILFFFLKESIIQVFKFPELNSYLALHHFFSPYFRFWQVITYFFTHASFLHVFFNMIVLYFTGDWIEREWGTKKFIWFYFICAIGSAILHFSLKINSETSVMGASGATAGLFMAFGFLYPNIPLYIYGLIPVRAKYLVILYIAIDLYMGINVDDKVAHFAHLGGMFTALAILLFWKYKGLLYRNERLF